MGQTTGTDKNTVSLTDTVKYTLENKYTAS